MSDYHLRAATHHLLAALPDKALEEAQQRLVEIWTFHQPKGTTVQFIPYPTSLPVDAAVALIAKLRGTSTLDRNSLINAAEAVQMYAAGTAFPVTAGALSAGKPTGAKLNDTQLADLLQQGVDAAGGKVGVARLSVIDWARVAADVLDIIKTLMGL